LTEKCSKGALQNLNASLKIELKQNGLYKFHLSNIKGQVHL